MQEVKQRHEGPWDVAFGINDSTLSTGNKTYQEGFQRQ